MSDSESEKTHLLYSGFFEYLQAYSQSKQYLLETVQEA